LGLAPSLGLASLALMLAFRIVKVPRVELASPQELDRSQCKEDCRKSFPQHDQPEADPPNDRDWHGVVCHCACRQDCVHAEDVLDEQQVRPWIMNVSGEDKRAQHRNSAGHENLDASFHHHRIAPRVPQAPQDVVFVDNIQDRISASAHAGSTGSFGNKGTRQTFMVVLAES
jgi:hypothetical protein